MVDFLPPKEEANLGLEVYFTQTEGIRGKLRILPEDFIVNEISRMPEENKNGEYTIAQIKVKNWETNRLIREMARRLHISRKRISIAGTKDKRGIKTQMISFHCQKEDVEKIKLPNVEFLKIYTSNKQLEVGGLIGNAFEIVIRDIKLSKDEVEKRMNETNEKNFKANGFPNFFGVQRFGSMRPITHLIGKAIIREDFENAVFTYCANPLGNENEENLKARKFLQETKNFKESLKIFPKKMSFERAILHYLATFPEDYVNALRQLPKNLLLMFIHAYQSYIFNKILSERIRRGLPLNECLIGDIVLPIDNYGLSSHDNGFLVNEDNFNKVNEKVKEGKGFVSGVIFGSESEFARGEMGEIEQKIIEEEKVKKEDFIIPKIKEISSTGTRRELFVYLGKVNYEVFEEDIKSKVSDEFKNMSNIAIKVKFSLPRGCYATSLLREFMKTRIIDY